MFLANETSSPQHLKGSIIILLDGEGSDFIDLYKLIIVISHYPLGLQNSYSSLQQLLFRFAQFLVGLRCLLYGLRNFQVIMQTSL